MRIIYYIILYLIVLWGSIIIFSYSKLTETTHVIPFMDDPKDHHVSILLWNNADGAVFDDQSCPVMCEITKDTLLLKSVDAVLFYPSSMGSIGEVYRSPVILPDKYMLQYWGNYYLKGPEELSILEENIYNTIMDFNVSYKKISQVREPMFCVNGKWGIDYYSAISKESRSGIALIDFGCDNHYKLYHLKKLVDLLDINNYGTCLNYFKDDKILNPNSENFEGDVISIYKNFKLAIIYENSNDTDYVTNRIYLSLLGGAIPIYMGAHNIEQYLPSRNSVILASDFNDHIALAKYITKVDNDSVLYQTHLQWRQEKINSFFVDRYNEGCSARESSFCKICKYILNRQSKMEHKLVTIAKKTREIEPHYFNFDGKTTIRIPHHTKLMPILEFSFGLWIRLDKDLEYTGGIRIIDKNLAGGIYGYNLDLAQEDGINPKFFLRLCISGTGCVYSRRDLKRNTWYHLSLVVKHSGTLPERYMHFYINGVEAGSPNLLYPQSDVKYHLCLGGPSEGDAPRFKGDIDEFSFWDKPLTQEEVIRLMYGQLSGFEEGLLLYFPFDEKGGTIIRDRSENNFAGVIDGNGKWQRSSGKPMVLSQKY